MLFLRYTKLFDRQALLRAAAIQRCHRYQKIYNWESSIYQEFQSMFLPRRQLAILE